MKLAQMIINKIPDAVRADNEYVTTLSQNVNQVLGQLGGSSLGLSASASPSRPEADSLATSNIDELHTFLSD